MNATRKSQKKKIIFVSPHIVCALDRPTIFSEFLEYQTVQKNKIIEKNSNIFFPSKTIVAVGVACGCVDGAESLGGIDIFCYP
jgi:hypothetical protein